MAKAIHTTQNGRAVVTFKASTEEYRVQFFDAAGIKLKGATYFTSDKADAIGTAEHETVRMLANESQAVPVVESPAVHEFASTGDAYDACQCDENIKQGDTLVIKAEKIVGVADTWPFAVTADHGQLHGIADLTKLPAKLKTGYEHASKLARELGLMSDTPAVPATPAGVLSISDDDICSDCTHCRYNPGNESACTQEWPATFNDDGYAISCVRFIKIAARGDNVISN